MAKYDIYQAAVYFSDEEGKKLRPILQVTDDKGDDTEYVFISGSSSAVKRCESGWPGDFLIKSWKEAGLNKLSVGRLSKKLEGCPTLIKKYGTLQPADIRRLRVRSKFDPKHIEKHRTEDLDDNFDWSGFND